LPQLKWDIMLKNQTEIERGRVKPRINLQQLKWDIMLKNQTKIERGRVKPRIKFAAVKVGHYAKKPNRD